MGVVTLAHRCSTSYVPFIHHSSTTILLSPYRSSLYITHAGEAQVGMTSLDHHQPPQLSKHGGPLTFGLFGSQILSRAVLNVSQCGITPLGTIKEPPHTPTGYLSTVRSCAYEFDLQWVMVPAPHPGYPHPLPPLISPLTAYRNDHLELRVPAPRPGYPPQPPLMFLLLVIELITWSPWCRPRAPGFIPSPQPLVHRSSTPPPTLPPSSYPPIHRWTTDALS